MPPIDGLNFFYISLSMTDFLNGEDVALGLSNDSRGNLLAKFWACSCKKLSMFSREAYDWT